MTGVDAVRFVTKRYVSIRYTKYTKDPTTTGRKPPPDSPPITTAFLPATLRSYRSSPQETPLLFSAGGGTEQRIMQQHVSNETPTNSPDARSAKERAHAFIVQAWSQITQYSGQFLHHARQIHPAAFLIAIFLAATAVFTLGSGLLAQTLTTVTLPETNKARIVANTAASAPAAPAPPKAEAKAPRYIAGAELKRMSPLPPKKVDTETLWLARVIYSETKRPEEQEVVAWVVRNRVETAYRGKNTYEKVVNDPYQFSAFNPGTATRARYAGLTKNSQTPGFQKALAIANQVKNAPDSLRPFSETTRHFYSPQSMVGGRTPAWARRGQLVLPERDFALESRRFRFYEDVG